LASFFEGTRILPNGTVLMNLPANHRLFPLAARLEKGWMSGPTDGIDPDGKGDPERAPTFRIVLEDKYAWGPPWYAPTWGVVYFLYNYQDPVDGRFVFRKAFGEFVNASGGREGKGAVENFEEVVLANPMPPIRGFERPKGSVDVVAPKTVAELDAVWKLWIMELRDEQQGKLERVRPYLQWGRAAILAADLDSAAEHFEKGLVASPRDVELLLDFAGLLADKQKNPDRAAKLVEAALSVLEAAEPPDKKAITAAERLLAKYDPKRDTLDAHKREMALAARGLVDRYLAAERPSMVMDVSWRLGVDLGIPDLFAKYEHAARTSGKSLRIWDLAYNEKDLVGWNAAGAGSPFTANGLFLDAKFSTFDATVFDYQALTLDRTTSGDFSMETEIMAERGKVNFAGFVFGSKDPSSFHGLFFFPGKEQKEGLSAPGYVDLLSSFGSGVIKTWRHVPVDTSQKPGASSAGTWHKLRVDVAGRFVDVWFDGEFMSTQEFSSIDVLRGSFGLMVGRGEARFKNVRYLASDPRDPVSAIERELRLSKLAGRGVEQTGSYLGQIPPWPKVTKWVQEPRESWQEAGRVPQLLVFFSQQQNDIVRLDQWLCDFEAQARRFGLKVVANTSPNDEKTIAEYLKTHPMPGSVGVDYRAPRASGIGESNEMFFTRRFNLPRLLLIDIDQRVVWEGDPGLIAGAEWKAGEGSFVDAPLEDLAARHKLDSVLEFQKNWTETALPALDRGDLTAALAILRSAREFEADYFPDAAIAQSRLGAVESAAAGLNTSAQSFARQGADPALSILVEWGRVLGHEMTPKLARDLKPDLESKLNKEWAAADKACLRWKNVSARKDVDTKAAASELLATLAGLEGLFPRELAADLQAALDASDDARFATLVAEHEQRPRLWLARVYFGWELAR
jgi:hypothetical protein